MLKDSTQRDGQPLPWVGPSWHDPAMADFTVTVRLADGELSHTQYNGDDGAHYSIEGGILTVHGGRRFANNIWSYSPSYWMIVQVHQAP